MSEPMIIQGGMGAGVSDWRLARAVSQAGQLGVVSSTALDNILARRLLDGDLDGSMRRALEAFPERLIADRILARYFIPGGKAKGAAYKPVPLYSLQPPRELEELTLAANFCEVFLAKEGHRGLVGINLLEKVQMPTLPSLYGAMLAGVDYVMMGAGIPRAIPALLDQLARHEAVALRINVQGEGEDDEHWMRFDPWEFMSQIPETLKRPKFLAVVASEVLAMTLAKKSNGKVDGFVVEGPLAGGHNAPPRGALKLNEKGEPVYGTRDEVNLEGIRGLGLPFWVAGAWGRPDKLKEALAKGAAGIQVGTLFAYCRESGLTENLKQWVVDKVLKGKIEVFTDPKASPTGFPFKVVKLEGTHSEKEDYEARTKVCDLGYLRQVFKRWNGTIGYRCPGEPEEVFLQKEGDPAEIEGRKCLCNGLMANIGLAQMRKDGGAEKPLVTSGDDIARIRMFVGQGKRSYGAQDVIRYLLGEMGGGLNPA
ncbi:MAG TPA: nitronate monooxygenase [bacterium]|nr:nitronate monooxygenase [bacterium]